VRKLTQNLTSKDRWVRYFSRNRLILLTQKKGERWRQTSGMVRDTDFS
jgi:hypothetical protein